VNCERQRKGVLVADAAERNSEFGIGSYGQVFPRPHYISPCHINRGIRLCGFHAIGCLIWKDAMKKPTQMEVVRRAYELWEKAGKPEGRDQEFYHQAERELENESEGPETPEDI
jgi:Protein of unknown function (DUF2934)